MKMRGLAFFCCFSAGLYALIGMTLGIYMAISHDHVLAPAHAHINLLGWLSMFVYGFFYHVVPAAAEQRLARIHVGLATLGVWFIGPGIAIAVLGMTEALAAIGSILTIVSMLLFVVIIGGSRRLPA
jgi:cbb3-type cytochrome oxidase subunit 1